MDFITLTQALRNQIMENYHKYKKELSNDNNEVEEDLDELDDEEDIWDDETDDENIQVDDDDELDDDDECEEELYSIYDEEVILKVIDDIKNSMYKNLIHMIIFSDCLEYIKSRAVRKRFADGEWVRVYASNGTFTGVYVFSEEEHGFKPYKMFL